MREELPRLRMHPNMGALVKMPGLDGWQRVSATGAVLPGRMSDDFASGPGWRELDVSERS